MPQTQAFGSEYIDRVYLNRTAEELWPQNIDNAIYTSHTCIANDNWQDCAVRAMDVLSVWISSHQMQGTAPNISNFQDSEVTRYLTSEGGPPDNSSWTVASTVGANFGRTLVHYWDWILENTTLPAKVNRPLIQPHFVDKAMKIRKPLVQASCQTYLNPDWQHDAFEFPHSDLTTPPLDNFKDEIWSLPNDFVLELKGNNSDIGNVNDTNRPGVLFDWFDTASAFPGAPSLGAVIIFKASNGSSLQNALSTCSFDGRWAPVDLYLDPRETVTIYQNSPRPMDILNGSAKVASDDLIQMSMSLEWANSMNVQGTSIVSPAASVVEQLIMGFGGKLDGHFSVTPEPGRASGYVMKSLDWRLSTMLGLYLTEGLSRAFLDFSKGSMLYRQAPNSEQSYVRSLNDLNYLGLKEGYRDGKLDWVEQRDSRWNSSIEP